MIRALTIRFGAMGIGLGALVILANVLHASPPLAMGSLMVYLLAGSLIIGTTASHMKTKFPPAPSAAGIVTADSG
jgi:hypothetical protein